MALERAEAELSNNISTTAWKVCSGGCLACTNAIESVGLSCRSCMMRRPFGVPSSLVLPVSCVWRLYALHSTLVPTITYLRDCFSYSRIYLYLLLTLTVTTHFQPVKCVFPDGSEAAGSTPMSGSCTHKARSTLCESERTPLQVQHQRHEANPAQLIPPPVPSHPSSTHPTPSRPTPSHRIPTYLIPHRTTSQSSTTSHTPHSHPTSAQPTPAHPTLPTPSQLTSNPVSHIKPDPPCNAR